MKTLTPQINLVLAWTGILAGFVSGMVLGMFFHRENWLGGYGSFKRRMYRLGHISLFGLGAVNLMFWLTMSAVSMSSPLVGIASWAFIAGAITMPICCILMAHFPKTHLLFAVPVISLITGGILTLAAIIRGQDWQEFALCTRSACACRYQTPQTCVLQAPHDEIWTLNMY